LLRTQRLVSDARRNVGLYSTIKDRKSPIKGSRPSVPHGTNFLYICYATYSQKNHACGSNENIVHITELVADNKLRDDDADDDEVQCNLTTASSSGRTGGKASSSQESCKLKLKLIP